MASIARPLVWFYHEFGLVSIAATGRNAYIIILARSMRMIAFGMTQVMLGDCFAEVVMLPKRFRMSRLIFSEFQLCSLPNSNSPTFASACL